jgi:serine/threonine-protein kinase
MSDDKDRKPPEEEPTVFASEPTAKTRPPEPRRDAIGIKVGDVLNHIFEVKRFLARGGMGEVFEGCNVHTDEKVAIKVMLPALASDEKVIAMFRKEAKTLTKLHHEALVEYRVLAQEPNLHILYIVTDFIEGTNLSASLGTLKPTPEELAGLLGRLAAGLGSAHALGAVHRDMSPDNVILENDDIRAPKIIDFGIAKDLAASSATIVGDGFAGKLNYVAPEQLGDYGREIGPWTDVYSLALVILAVAQGRNVDLSGSLVDAIDKRRRGPDLAAIPANLRPLIEAMLRPDPTERLRSMDEVVAMLGGAASIPGPTTVRESLPPPPADPAITSAPSRGPPGGLIIGGAIALMTALALGGWYWSGGRIPSFGQPGPQPPSNSSRGAAETARAAINSVLPSVRCTWLDIGGIENGANGLNVAMRGVAGDEGIARDQLRAALVQAGIANPNINFADVAQITQAGCAALDAYRQIRATDAGHLTSVQLRYRRGILQNGRYAGQEGITALLDLVDDPGRDFALIGIEPSGRLTPIVLNRAGFEQALASSVDGRPISRTADNRYRVQLDSDHEGWSGILLLTGRGRFEPGLVAPDIGDRGPDWRDDFLGAAARGRWSAEMVWYEAVDGDGGGEAGKE